MYDEFLLAHLYVGNDTLLCVPVLEYHAPKPEGDHAEVRSKLLALDGDVYARLVLPTFMGVEIGQPAFLLTAGASWEQNPRRQGAVVQLPTAYSSSSSPTAWGLAMLWEANVSRELGVDGGSNRNFKAIFESFSMKGFVDQILVGLSRSNIGADDRHAFQQMLRLYLATYPAFFEDLRRLYRPPPMELVHLLADFKQMKDSGNLLR